MKAWKIEYDNEDVYYRTRRDIELAPQTYLFDLGGKRWKYADTEHVRTQSCFKRLYNVHNVMENTKRLKHIFKLDQRVFRT